VNHKASKYIN